MWWWDVLLFLPLPWEMSAQLTEGILMRRSPTPIPYSLFPNPYLKRQLLKASEFVALCSCFVDYLTECIGVIVRYAVKEYYCSVVKA